MRIVKPTNPPTMAVTIDTVISGKVTLALTPAHTMKNRTDTVCAGRGMVYIIVGAETFGIPEAPPPPAGTRAIAWIYVNRGATSIYEGNIEEVEE